MGVASSARPGAPTEEVTHTPGHGRVAPGRGPRAGEGEDGVGRENRLGGLLGHLRLQGFWRPWVGVASAREPQVCQGAPRCHPTLGPTDMTPDPSWLLPPTFPGGSQAGAPSPGTGVVGCSPTSGLGSPHTATSRALEEPSSRLSPSQTGASGLGWGWGDGGAPRGHNGHAAAWERRASQPLPGAWGGCRVAAPGVLHQQQGHCAHVDPGVQLGPGWVGDQGFHSQTPRGPEPADRETGGLG